MFNTREVEKMRELLAVERDIGDVEVLSKNTAKIESRCNHIASLQSHIDEISA